MSDCVVDEAFLSADVEDEDAVVAVVEPVSKLISISTTPNNNNNKSLKFT